MDTDISNGSSDSAASGTALLSRKGLFGKSGVLNQNLDASIAIHQDPSKLEHAKAKMDADEPSTMELGEQNTSSMEPSAPELSPEEQNISQDDELTHDSEHSNANESGDVLEMAEGDVPCPMEADEKPDATEADAPQASTCSEDEPKEANEGRKEEEEVEEEEGKGHSKEDDPHADAGGDHMDEDSGEEPDAPKAHVSSPEPSEDRVEEAEIVEEVFVKKIISMDTDDTDDVAGIQLPSESAVAPSTDEDEDVEPRPTSEDIAEEVSKEQVEAAFEEQPEEDEDEKEEEEDEEEKEEGQGKEEETVDEQEAVTIQESETVRVGEKAEHDVEQDEEEEGDDEKEEKEVEDKAPEQEDVHKDEAQSRKEEKHEEEEEGEEEEEQEQENEPEEERREEESEKTKETDESCLVESADAEDNDQAECTTTEEAQAISENEEATVADAEESEQIDDKPEQGKPAEETKEAGDEGEEEEEETEGSSAPRRRSSSRRAPTTPASAVKKSTPRASARAKATSASKATAVKATPAKATPAKAAPAKAAPAKAAAAKASPAPKATPVTKATSTAKSTPAAKAASTVKAPKSTPVPRSAPRTASRRRHEEEEKADDEEKPEVTPKRRKSMDTKKNEENVVESKTPLKRGRRSVAEEAMKTPATPATPTQRGRKSAKKDAVTEADDENEPEPDQKSVGRMRGRPAKERKEEQKMEATPKASATRRGRSRNSEKEAFTAEKESKKETKVAEEATPRRGRKSPAATPVKPAKAAKTPRSQAKKEQGDEEHDPYDIDTEMERHPEPLKNIQMEVQSFGEVKYAKVGSGKYERTEKTAEQRVGNLAEMTPRAKQRKSLADLTPGRKKATASGGSTAPQTSRRSRKGVKEEADSEETEEAMEVDGETQEKTTPKRKGKGEPTPSNSAQASGRKRRGAVETPAVPSKRSLVEVPQLGPDELLAVDHPHDEHAPYEAGARVYAMFDGLFYPAIVVSRDGLGRFKVHFIEDNVVKDVPPAGVIPLRALDAEKECYYAASAEKDRVAVKVLSEPNAKSASAWFEADFELERLDDEGNPTGKKLKAVWTQLALSKDDWKDYINKKSREATDVIADNIESTEDRQLRRSKTATPSQPAMRRGKSTPKAAAEETSSSAPAKTPGRGGRQKKGAQKTAPSKEKSAAEEEAEGTTEAQNEQIFTGKLFILTSANRPNTDTGFKKKFMTDFISSHGGLVVDDMKEVDEHPEMERFLISDTHYRTHKYLAALVRAMPCVSHEWIYTCLNEKKLVDYKPFLLPSGVSILDEQEYPLPTERGLLLRNKRVMVHSNVTPPSKKSMSFEQIWVPMVPQLGGEIVTDMPNEEGQLDILLTDHSATPSIVEKARKIGCIVVSSEWLIQGIIMDRLPDVNAHQKFLHNGGICT